MKQGEGRRETKGGEGGGGRRRRKDGREEEVRGGYEEGFMRSSGEDEENRLTPLTAAMYFIQTNTHAREWMMSCTTFER